MKITKSYLRNLIKEAIQQGSAPDVLAVLKQNLPTVAKSKLVVPGVANLAGEMLEDFKSYQRISDKGEDISKYVSSAVRHNLYKILKHISDLHSSNANQGGEMNDLAIAYNELLKVYKVLPAPR